VNAIDDIIGKVQVDFAQDFPDAQVLTKYVSNSPTQVHALKYISMIVLLRRDITVYAHESAKKFHRLDEKTFWICSNAPCG
jgi:hypothetical protein